MDKANAKAMEMIKDIFRTYRCQIIIGLIGNVVGMAAELLSPLYVGYIIDAIIERDMEKVKNLCVIWMAITVSSSFINGLQGFILNWVTHKIGHKLRKDLFIEIMSKDIQFFDENKTGSLMSRLQNDCQKIEQAMSTQIALVLKSTIFCTTVIIIIFVISWRMTLFMIAVMMPLMFYAKCVGTYYKKLMKWISDASAKVSEINQECFGNIRTVKAFGTEDYQTKINSDRLDDLFLEEKKKANFSALHEFVMTGCMFGCMDAIIWMSAYLYFNHGFSIGKINSFNSYLFSILFNFAMLSAVLTEVIGMFGTMASIAEINLYEPKIRVDGGEDVTDLSLSDGSLKLDDIKFTYPTK